MKRRHFLHLAAGAAAGAFVVHSSPQAAAGVLASEPDELLAVLLEKGKDGSHQWIIDRSRDGSLDSRLHQAGEPLILASGRRYRLRLMNATGSAHSVHIPNHHFEVARVEQAPVSGMLQKSIRLDRYDVVEADVFLQQTQPLVID
jgi:FtsP/CotA-like multicopper oxidase with cupredoxin domain